MKISFPTMKFKSVLPSLNTIIDAGVSATNTDKASSTLVSLNYLNHAAQIVYRVKNDSMDGLPISLFGLLVAKSSYGKGRLAIYYSSAQKKFEIALQTEQETAEHPRSPRIVSNSGSVEGLKMDLATGYPFHCIFNSEAGNFFDSFPFKGQYASSTFSGLIQLKESEARIDAIKKNHTDFGIEKVKYRSILRNTSFSLYCAMQRSVFINLFTTSAGLSQGFLGRCFIVSPDLMEEKPPVITLDKHIVKDQKDYFDSIVSKLYKSKALSPSGQELEYKMFYLQPAEEELLEKFMDHFTPYEDEAGAFSHGGKFIAKKYEHALELASTLQAYRVIENNEIVMNRQIDRDILELALHLLEYFHQHFMVSIKPYYKRITDYGIIGEAEIKLPHDTHKFLLRLKKTLRAKNIDQDKSFVITTHLLKNYKLYRDPAKLHAQVSILIDAGILRVIKENCPKLGHALYSFIQPAFEENEPYPSFFNPPKPEPEDPSPTTEPDDEPTPPSGTSSHDSTSTGCPKPPVLNFNNVPQVNHTPRPQLDREEIKSRIRLHDYISKFAELDHKTGQYHCPLHDDGTASLMVYPQTNTFNCFGCNKGGDIYQFISLQNNLDLRRDFQQILTIAADYLGLSLSAIVPAVYIQPEQSAAKIEENMHHARTLYTTDTKEMPPAYLSNRLGQSIATLPNIFRYRKYYYHEQKRDYPVMMLPFIRGKDEITGIHLTFLNDDLTAKANIRPDKRCLGTIRGSYIPIKKGLADKPLLIGEGIETALAACVYLKHQGDCIASGSATNMPNLQLPDDVTSVIIAVDNDEAGRVNAYKLRDRLVSDGYAVELTNPPPEYNDYCDLLQKVNNC